MIMSKNLHAVLRHEGYAKLASEVLRNQNEYVHTIDNVVGAARSLAMKLATNLENERIIAEGLHSLRRLQEIE